MVRSRLAHRAGPIDSQNFVPLLLQITSHATLAAAYVESEASRRRDELQKMFSMEAKVAIRLLWSSDPGDPLCRVCVPAIAKHAARSPSKAHDHLIALRKQSRIGHQGSPGLVT